MTADLYSTRDSTPLGIRTDAQPPRNGAFAKMAGWLIFAGGLGAGSPQQARLWPHNHCLPKFIVTS